MSKYFKIIGYIGIVSFIALSIWRLVMLIIDISFAARSPYEGMALAIILDIVFFLLSIFFGPALSLLFVSYGKHLEARVIYPDSESFNSAGSISKAPLDHSYEKENNLENDDEQENESDRHEIIENKAADKLTIPDLTINTDTIIINGTTYNAEFLGIYNLSIVEDKISFTLAGTKYTVSYENSEEASNLCNFLKKYSKD